MNSSYLQLETGGTVDENENICYMAGLPWQDNMQELPTLSSYNSMSLAHEEA